MTVTSKWVALHEVSDYLKKGWREVKLEGGFKHVALMVSPEEPASEMAAHVVEYPVCPNCWKMDTGHSWRVNGLLRYTCQPASEPAKVETLCPNCGEREVGQHQARDGGETFYTCKPAQPEPVANIVLDGATEHRRRADLQRDLDRLPEPVAGTLTFDLGAETVTFTPEPVAEVEQPTEYTRNGAFDVVAHVCKFLLVHEADLGAFPTAHELKEAVDCIVSSERDMVARCVSQSPVAEEMPPAPLHSACFHLRRLGEPVPAYMVEQFWRAHAAQRATVKDIRVCTECSNQFIPTAEHPLAQPTKVRMTEDVQFLLETCDKMLVEHEALSLGYQASLRHAVDRVRAQAAEEGKVRMPKVRSYFLSLSMLPEYRNDQGRAFLAEVKAELDAAEGKVAG